MRVCELPSPYQEDILVLEVANQSVVLSVRQTSLTEIDFCDILIVN